MPPERIDEMYWGGYCDETLMNVSKTDLKDGAAERMEWIKNHIDDCLDCRNATKFKNLEYNIAKRLNQIERFNAGQSLSDLDGYSTAFDQVMNSAMEMGIVVEDDLQWMQRMVLRHGKSWPGRMK